MYTGADGGQEDERAQLVLQLLLHAAEQPSPSLTHLLMGFHVEDGPDGESLPQRYLLAIYMRLMMPRVFCSVMQGWRAPFCAHCKHSPACRSCLQPHSRLPCRPHVRRCVRACWSCFTCWQPHRTVAHPP